MISLMGIHTAEVRRKKGGGDDDRKQCCGHLGNDLNVIAISAFAF
jgi:hypothetical protein